MGRPRISMLLVCSTVVCGLVMAMAGQLQSQPTKASQAIGPPKEWEFPDAESHRRSSAGNVHAGDYATSKSFEEVWTYYAKKTGCKEKYQPNGVIAGGTAESKGAEIQILNSTDDPMVANANRPKVTTSTLIRRGSGANVTVFLSRGKDEDKTYITLIVEGK